MERVAFAELLVRRVGIGDEIRVEGVPDDSGLELLLSQPGLDVDRGDD